MKEMNEEIQKLVESEKYAELTEGAEASMMGMMLENAMEEAEKVLAEGTVASDVAQFTPIIMPLVRRVYPNLIANELLGVQPMALPTGFIYALTNRYLGNTTGGTIEPTAKGQILVMATAPAVGDTVTGVDAAGAAATAVVKYVEGDKVLVEVAGNFLVPDANISAVFTNELAFGQVLNKYTGPMTTAQAEVLGDGMSEVGFDISRKSVEAKSRALKGKYSVEMYQDLKSQHGLSADDEIMSLISYEVQAELDREIVNFVNTNATQVSNSFAPATADGRWEIEKYRAEVIKMKRESVQIGLDTKRGQGNIVVVSPSVATMLEEVGSFTIATQASTVKQPVSGGVAGTFDNKFKVVVDQFAASDYATVMYKGADRRDSMGFFAPYVPLSFTKVTKYETGQPAIIAKTRYALETIPGVETPISNDRAKQYARSFGVDFTGTALAR
jgi:hypothetical protein